MNNWHAIEVGEVLQRLEVDPTAGLSSVVAAERLAKFGPNELSATSGPSRLSILIRQFKDVLVWVLLAAGIISGFILNEWVDTGVILAIVVLNAVIGYTQEVRAESALGELKEMSAPEARVFRDGQMVTLAAVDLVPGDIVSLEAGDRVPADVRLIELVRLEVDEAALTGESFPVSKQIEPTAIESGTADRLALAFAGTVVANGRGRAAVVFTGRDTEMGKIADLLVEEEPRTPLSLEMDRVGRSIAVLALGIAVLIFVLGLARGNSVESMFLTAVALAVAAIPEGLPAVNTITLARGVQRMAGRNAIIRKLTAVEALGSASVICTDKTGTLTRNEMSVQRIGFAGASLALEEAHGSERRIHLYGLIAALCNDGQPSGRGFIGDPTETALLKSVDPIVLNVNEIRSDYPRVDELGFDSRRKRMATLHHTKEGYLLAVKGAPETIIELSGHVEASTGQQPIDDDLVRRAKAEAAEFAGAGLRTLAFAYRMFDDRPVNLDAAESDLTLVAVVGMSDEIRPEVPAAVTAAERAGLEVVMVTGDHEVTARAIAAELGLTNERRGVMGGAELRSVEEDELASRVNDYGVFARVDPVDKVKLVRAWQHHGGIVAMTGDGVNDAPALKAADIGVAMGSGTAVSKEASSMVLADDNFASIVAAIEEGRGIFSNLKKVVYFLLSANVSEVLVMVFGFLVFGGLGEPLLAVQILWINLVTDGLPAIALGMDPPVAGLMDRDPDRRRDILGPAHQVRILWQGAILAAGALSAYAYGHFLRDVEWEHVRTIGFSALVGVQMLHVFNVRAQGTSVWKRGFFDNRLLLVAITLSLLLQLGVVYLPIGNTLFATVPIDVVDWIVILVLQIVPFLIVDFFKRLGLRRNPNAITAMD